MLDSVQSMVSYRLSANTDYKLSLHTIAKSNRFLVPFVFSQFLVFIFTSSAGQQNSYNHCQILWICIYN